MTGVDDRATATAVRPDVLAYPSPTTSRYLVFATALLSTGLFVGGWVHNQTVGQKWADTYLDCRATYGADLDFTDASFQAQQEVLDCVADVEWTRAFFTLGGAGLSLLVAVVILVLAPVVIRRRRGLKELDARLDGATERFRVLADEAGVGGRVRPMLGRTSQRDAFSFGRPGRYVVALPPAVAVRWRDASLYDPLVSHELAHVRHRDVALAWLTRSMWFGLVPLLLLPLVVGVVTGETSLLPGYVWRASLLGLVVVLVSAALLRSREHDADLGAARLRGDPGALTRILGVSLERPGARRPAWLANHPSPSERRRVLDHPGSVTGTGFVDGFTAAFLVALSLPLLVAAVSPAAAQLGDSNASYLVAAAVLGPLLAGSVGLGAWRMALYGRLADTRGSELMLAVGVGVGLVLGKAASLQQTAAGLSGLHSPAWLVVIGLAGAGATLLSSALGHAWADAAPRLPGVRAAWLVALLTNALLFTALLWASELFVFAADNGGWIFARAGLVLTLATWPVTLLVLGAAALAMLTLVAVRRTATGIAPPWLLEEGAAAEWPRPRRPSPSVVVAAGVAAGVAAVGVILAFRLVQGEATTDDEIFARVVAFEWMAGSVAATCVVVLAVLYPRWGAAGGLVAGVIAAVVVTAGFLTINAIADDRFHVEMVTLFLVPALSLALFLSAVILPLGSLAARVSTARLSGATAVGVVCVTALAVSAAVLPARGLLVDAHPVTDSLAGASPQQPEAASETESAQDTELQELTTYLNDVAPDIEATDRRIMKVLAGIIADEEMAGPARIDQLQAQVLPPLRGLRDEIGDLEVTSGALQDAHHESEEAVRLELEQVAALVEYWRHEDAALIDRAVKLREEADAHWSGWYAKLEALVDALTG